MQKYLVTLTLSLCASFAIAQQTLPDFGHIHDVKQKKQTFFNYLRPMAEKANQQVLAERKQLLKLKNKKVLAPKDRALLAKLSKHYDVHEKTPAKTLQQLLTKVDAIPTALLLAQAANESAWGTSRFARLGNNLFGQWCYTAHCGIVPAKRTKGQHHEVKSFASAYDSIKAYLDNLNRNRSYQGLRDIRTSLRKNHQPITGYQLAAGLSHYSERGESYVREIQSMIRSNHLDGL
jgi:Bax protein